MKRRYRFVSGGFSLVELMVAMTIVGVVLAGTYAGFNAFSNAVAVVMEENTALEDISIATDLLRRDLQMAGWGLPTAGRIASDEAGGINVLESGFGVDIDGDDSADDTIHTDRLFVADGLKMVTDSAPGPRGGYYPDGDVDLNNLLAIADAEAAGGQKALLTAATSGAASVTVSTSNVNYDTEDSDGWYSGYNCIDIRDTMAVIVAGNTSGGGYSVEGHRIGSVSPSPSANTKKCGGVSGSVRSGTTAVTFISGETLASGYSLDSASIGVPAIAWYVKQADDNVYWLYRNENKVLANVVDFQVAYGIDVDQDGLEWAATLTPSSSALWKRPEHTLDYLASDDPAYPRDNSSGEVANHLRPQEVIESVRAVWLRLIVLRRSAVEEDDEDNIVASSYETMVNLRN